MVEDAAGQAPAFDRTPLAAFGGARPPAPAWFEAAVSVQPERSTLEVGGARIELLAWGATNPARPGLLFLHGGGAHADWWSFIAPFFSAPELGGDRRCVAISWSGMGRSQHREAYDFDLYLREALAGAQAGGLFARAPGPIPGPIPDSIPTSIPGPIIVAHSFGGAVATHIAAKVGERFSGAVLIDVGVRPPDRRWKMDPPEHAHTLRESEAAILARFRLQPPQPCENLYLVDHIARASVEAVDEGEAGGWRWRFDPRMWARLGRASRLEQEAELAAARCPLAFVYGARSRLMDRHAVEYTAAHAAPGTPMIAVPQAHHHVMLDQPLALVAALRALLSAWPQPSPHT